MITCPFCEHLDERDVREAGKRIAANAYATAFFDRYPVSEGHTLVVPHRHVGSIFELSGDEQTSIWSLVGEVRDRLRERFNVQPDAFNVGPNDGVEAVNWFRKAAEQGNPRAQTKLAAAYFNGRGVGKDNAEGMKWLKQALAQRDPEAKELAESIGGIAAEKQN